MENTCLALSSKELELLKKHYKKAQNNLIRDRSHTVILYCHTKFKIADIATVLFRNQRTIRNWINRFKEHRIASIFTRYDNNENHHLLTRIQKEEVKKALQKTPEENGIPAKYWDIKPLKKYVSAKFNIEYKDNEGYRLLFKYCNFSFHKPNKFDVRRKEDIVEKKIQEIKEELETIKNEAKKNNQKIAILSSDETRVQSDVILRSLWLPTGVRSIVKEYRQNWYQNIIGFLDHNTNKLTHYNLEWQNTKTIIESLQKLQKQKEYKNKDIIVIIWDNARFHKSKELIQELSKSLKKIHLINLPPYAPDKNPVEHIWGYLKDKLSRDVYEIKEEMLKDFNKFAKREFNYACDYSKECKI